MENNDDTTKERKKFEKGALVTTLLGTVSQRLGFDKTLDLGRYVLYLDFHYETRYASFHPSE